MKATCWQVAAAVAVLCGACAARGQQITPGALSAQLRLVTTVTSSSGGAPNFGVHAGDSRFLYVGEQNGKIRTLDFAQTNPLSATNFLDIAAVLGTTFTDVDDTGTGERGLLGAAFHPDFNNPANPNGYRKFYTFTSETIGSATPHFVNPLEPPDTAFAYNCQSVVREWTAGAPNGAGLTTIDTSVASRVVMRIGKPGRFHNGGGMAFGPDNLLYISLGDGGGGNANGGNDGGNDRLAYQGHTNPGNADTTGGWAGPGNAQDRRNVYGKILRIKPTLDEDPDSSASPIAGAGWRVPKSNPFTAETNAATPVPGYRAFWADEIFAYGFRNPFRISFDDATGKLYAADVGQDRNSFSREELSVITSGGNYGWVKKSGTELNTTDSGAPYAAPPNLIDPIAQYRTLANAAGTNPAQPALTGGLAIIGGYVYHGSDLPHLQGKYIFGDLNRGDNQGRLLYTDVAEPGLNPVFDLSIVGSVTKPSALLHGVAEDAAGELYYLFGNGQVMKLVAVPEPGGVVLALTAAALFGRVRRCALGGMPSSA
jgi:glucose/arabinose dehydrogenase